MEAVAGNFQVANQSYFLLHIISVVVAAATAAAVVVVVVVVVGVVGVVELFPVAPSVSSEHEQANHEPFHTHKHRKKKIFQSIIEDCPSRKSPTSTLGSAGRSRGSNRHLWL